MLFMIVRLTYYYFFWEMLISAISALIKNPVKESFYGEKKTINILTIFFIFHKSDVKTFK